MNYLSQIGTDVILNILLGLIILIVGMKLVGVIIKLIAKGKGFHKLDQSVQSFIKSFVKIILYALVVSSALICWGVPTASFMTVFASAGVAIGLALQGALSNFAGGLMILFFKPFSVGDFIENGAVSGTVKEITVIYTILTTGDNKVITIPNGTLTNSNVINYSKMDIRRVDLKVSASYEDDVERVKAILLSVANGHPLVLKDPEPLARLNEHGSDALIYNVRVWCQNADYWTVYYDLTEGIKKAFDENSVSIPFRKLDLNITGNGRIG